jgi:hypothetical protein
MVLYLEDLVNPKDNAILAIISEAAERRHFA